MTKFWVLGAVLLVARVAFGEIQDQTVALLEQAAKAKGAEYLAARSNLVALGSNAVPQFTELSSNLKEPWQIRLMAGIVAERIQRTVELADLINRNWRNDPEYEPNWDKYRAGPVMGLAPLVKRRYKELGLIWHYVEMTWKETEEHSKAVFMDEDWWRAAARGACRDSPVFGLLVKVLDERIRNDISFKDYERWGEYHFLLGSGTNAALPTLLELIPLVPENDLNHDRDMLKVIEGMAQPEDAPLIEKHFKDKGQDVPEILRGPLQTLKDRQNEKTTIP